MDSLTIFAAKYLIAAPLLALIYLAIKLDRKKRLELLYLVILGGLLIVILSQIGAHLYSDPRPYIADSVTPLIRTPVDNGFPSDHTLLSASIGFLVLVFSRRLGIGLLIIALCIGTARVVAGVHHGIDVAGGFMFAGTGVLLATQAIKARKKLFKKKD